MLFVTVNDNRERLDDLTRLLLSAFRGNVVYQYSDPMRVSERVPERRVDAVFVEAQMNKISGLELLRLLRRRKPELPVFVLSDTEDCREAAIEEGAAGFLLYPVTEQGLKDALLTAGQASA